MSAEIIGILGGIHEETTALCEEILGPGAVAFATPWEPHGVANYSDGNLVLLVAVAPNPNRQAHISPYLLESSEFSGPIRKSFDLPDSPSVACRFTYLRITVNTALARRRGCSDGMYRYLPHRAAIACRVRDSPSR